MYIYIITYVIYYISIYIYELCILYVDYICVIYLYILYHIYISYIYIYNIYAFAGTVLPSMHLWGYTPENEHGT